MHYQPYVGRIALALCTRKKLLKSGEIRHFYGSGIRIACVRFFRPHPGWGPEEAGTCNTIVYKYKVLWYWYSKSNLEP